MANFKAVLEITKSIGPWKTFQATMNGSEIATVRKVRDQWLLTDRIGSSFESNFPLVKGLTSCKAFNTKAEAITFIKKYYN